MQGIWRQLITAIVVSIALLACAHDPYSVPVIDASGYEYGKRRTQHKVRKGDTLYAIAFKYGTTVTEIARLNGIKEPYLIHPQQLLLVDAAVPVAKVKKRVNTTNRSVKKPPAKTTVKAPVPVVAPPVAAPVVKPVSAKPTVVQAPAKPVSKPKPVKPKPSPVVSSGANERWLPPSTSPRGAAFSLGKTSHKGIDYHGKMGAPITASRSGVVVYAGSGLKAYGLLVIIKHANNYLSAYAYNEKILVKEGQAVKQGQRIASMGVKGDKPTLYFEIRRNGKSVNPDALLGK